MTAPATRALIERLDPLAGQRILDVAAGCGDPSLAIAARVGPTGRVTATDPVPAMVAALRHAALAAGLTHVDARVAPAESLPVADASHDGACSRFGVMFFASPPAALSEMRRALRRSGRLVLACWGPPADNPYFSVTMEALDAAGVPPLQPAPGVKTVFEFGDPGRLAAVAREAGWKELREESVRFTMTIPDTAPAAALDALARLSCKVESRLSELDAAARERARAALAARVEGFRNGPDLGFPAHARLVSGRA
jgi:ubiquinone/menaquinone biosynthesis C-methylase UbiE